MSDLFDVVLAIAIAAAVWYAMIPFQKAAAEKKAREQRRQNSEFRRSA